MNIKRWIAIAASFIIAYLTGVIISDDWDPGYWDDKEVAGMILVLVVQLCAIFLVVVMRAERKRYYDDFVKRRDEKNHNRT